MSLESEIRELEALARELTSNLDPERRGALLDLDSAQRKSRFQRLHRLALGQLDQLDLSEAQREEVRAHVVLLGETALEDQGLFPIAAALYLLAHDERCSADDPSARFDRVLLRLKLAHALLLADEDGRENIRRCADLVRWTIPQADALWNQPGIPETSFFDLQYRLHYWLAGRYKELELFRDAADHFSQAAVAARTANDRVGAALGLADCYEKQGDPQRANEMLMLHEGDIAEVDDADVLELWTMTRNWLHFLLGGKRPAKEDWANAPQWSFLARLSSAFLDFDRQPGAPTREEAIAISRGDIDSMRDLLPPSLTWRVLPQGPWFLFLDGALYHRFIETRPRTTNDSTWFGQDRGVQTCLRSSVHPATRRRIDFSRGWLGIGDVPGRGNLPDLPNSRREIEQIRDFLKKNGYPAEALFRRQAHSVRFRKMLRARRPAVLHFAVHGCLDRDFPDAACLFLADASRTPEREILPFRRVQELDLEDIDLVVLSACRSATGLSGRAAGFEGLAWAFLRAGAAQVLASRFSVRDAATAALINIFYRHLQHLPAAEALGRTRTVMSRERNGRVRGRFLVALELRGSKENRHEPARASR